LNLEKTKILVIHLAVTPLWWHFVVACRFSERSPGWWEQTDQRRTFGSLLWLHLGNSVWWLLRRHRRTSRLLYARIWVLI